MKDYHIHSRHERSCKVSANEELNDAIFYPSGASVGKEGFDE